MGSVFIFENKKLLENIETEGALVGWLQKQDIKFNRIDLYGSKEIGTLLSYSDNNDSTPRCRPFNSMEFNGDIIIKRGINEQGKKIAVDEIAWYKHVKELGFENIPEIFEYEPLKMKRVQGKNIFEYDCLTQTQKREILRKLITALKELHNLEPLQPVNLDDVEDNYLTKTALVNEVLSLPNLTMTIENNDIISLLGKFSTSELQDSFWYREIGIFIVDPDDESKEILYAYGNRNDKAEFITPHVNNYQILKEIECKISVGESSNVKIFINNKNTLNTFDFTSADWQYNTALEVYTLNTGQMGVGVNIFRKSENGMVTTEFVDIVINSAGVITLQATTAFDGYLIFA